MAVPCTGRPPARVPDRLPRHHRATRCERATVCSGSIQRVECLISAGSFGAVHGCVGQIDEVVDQRAVVVARGSRECSRWRRGERGLGPVLSEAHGLPVRTIAPTIGHKRFLSGVTTRARRGSHRTGGYRNRRRIDPSAQVRGYRDAMTFRLTG